MLRDLAVWATVYLGLGLAARWTIDAVERSLNRGRK
jgi:hypothetical protein